MADKINTVSISGFLPDAVAGDDVPLEGGRVPQRRPAADGDAVLQERLVQRRTPRGIRLSTGKYVGSLGLERFLESIIFLYFEESESDSESHFEESLKCIDWTIPEVESQGIANNLKNSGIRFGIEIAF